MVKQAKADKNVRNIFKWNDGDPYSGNLIRGWASFDIGQAHMGVLVPINYPVESYDRYPKDDCTPVLIQSPSSMPGAPPTAASTKP